MTKKEERRFREAMLAMGESVCSLTTEDRAAWVDGFVEGALSMFKTMEAAAKDARCGTEVGHG